MKVDYSAYYGKNQKVLVRVCVHWLTRTLPLEFVKWLSYRTLADLSEYLFPGILFRHLAHTICPRGSLSHVLLSLFTPGRGLSSLAIYTGVHLFFHVCHPFCCHIFSRERSRGIRKELASSTVPSPSTRDIVSATLHTREDPPLPRNELDGFFSMIQYLDDNYRYWFETCVCDWTPVVSFLPGRPASQTEEALRQIHAHLTPQQIVAHEIAADVPSLSARHLLLLFHAFYFKVPLSFCLTSISVLYAETHLYYWLLSLASQWTYQRVQNTSSKVYPPTFVYDRAHEVAYVCYHFIYILWTLILRSPLVQNIYFLRYRVIPSCLKEKEHFFSWVARLTAEEREQAIKELRKALASQETVPEEAEIPLPFLFLEGKLTKKMAKKILALLEESKMRTGRMHTLFRLGARCREVSAKEAKYFKQNGTGCSVCLSPFLEGDVIMRLRCGHMFHDNEILRWLESSGGCPICRKSARISFFRILESVLHAFLAFPSALHLLKVTRINSGFSGKLLRFL